MTTLTAGALMTGSRGRGTGRYLQRTSPRPRPPPEFRFLRPAFRIRSTTDTDLRGDALMKQPTRRAFSGGMLASLTAYGLIETLWYRNLFADGVKPTIAKWVNDLQELCKDVKTQKIKDVDFQAK